jgi:hypothetical protein
MELAIALVVRMRRQLYIFLRRDGSMVAVELVKRGAKSHGFDGLHCVAKPSEDSVILRVVFCNVIWGA